MKSPKENGKPYATGRKRFTVAAKNGATQKCRDMVEKALRIEMEYGGLVVPCVKHIARSCCVSAPTVSRTIQAFRLVNRQAKPSRL